MLGGGYQHEHTIVHEYGTNNGARFSIAETIIVVLVLLLSIICCCSYCQARKEMREYEERQNRQFTGATTRKEDIETEVLYT
tara:strand:- start:64 stop:309 length:246 start_codon:yes stop_codon:yes gene_type:complete